MTVIEGAEVTEIGIVTDSPCLNCLSPGLSIVTLVFGSTLTILAMECTPLELSANSIQYPGSMTFRLLRLVTV